MAAILALLLCTYVALPLVLQDLRERRLLRTCRRHRLIALTFDDGPGRQQTPKVLERLAAADAPATFFVLGRAVTGHLDLIATMRAHGHEIGSHGEDHTDHLRSLPWRGVRDTSLARRRLLALLRYDTARIAFRPPHGRMNLLSLAYVWLRRMPVAGWTHDGFDTRLLVDVPPAVTAASLRRTGGGVLLLHDFDRTIPNPSARVLERLDAVLALQREGFRFVRFRELEAIARTGTVAIAPLAVPAAPAEPAHATEPAPTRRQVRELPLP